ncbi:MAG: hypothetical protein RIC55_25430 [Pirellulaceae bacterium]
MTLRRSLMLTFIAVLLAGISWMRPALGDDPMSFARANALIEQARALVDEAAAAKEAEAAQAKREQARKKYEEARRLMSDYQAGIKEKLEVFPPVVPPGDPRIAKRARLRADYLQTRLLGAAIVEESAELYDGEEGTNRLQQAERLYREIYETYRTRLAGLYARMYQGRCLAKLHQPQSAAEVLSDLLNLPNEPQEFRGLRVRVYVLAAKAWCDDSLKRYAQAINYGESLLEAAAAEELASALYLEARLNLARAYKLQGDAFQPAAEAALSYDKAKQHAEFVAKHESKHQTQAKQLLSELAKRR